VIQVTYRVGGGLSGNVTAGSIQTIVGAPQLALLGATVSNPNPASGGSDRESIESAVQHAPAVFRSLKRAVTAADYEALALSFKGVGKVQASGTGWNTVTLYVAPSGGGNVSDVLEANLKAYFEDKRMVSQIVEVQDVHYVHVFVTAEVGVQSYYVSAEVQAKVHQAAAALLAFDNVTFGQTIYLSNFYQAIETVPGVQFVNVTEFRREDQPAPAVASSGKVTLLPHEIPVPPDDVAYAAGVKVVITNQGGL
jgi:predicted phage baseplate assembly protein